MTELIDPCKAVIDMASNISNIAWEANMAVSAFLDPENESWTVPGVVEAALALKAAAEQLRKVAADVEQVAADALEPGARVTVDEHVWKRGTRSKKEWSPEGEGRLRDEMVRTVARGAALDPLSGELDAERARVAQQVLDLFDKWQTINPKSFKTGALKQAGLSLEDYCEVHTVAVLQEVPQ